MIVDELKGTPDGIQFDKRRNTIYWTNMGLDFNADDGSIEAIDLNGENRHVLAGKRAFTTPKQLYLDASRELLYWCDREGGAVWRSKTDGSELTRLVDRSSAEGGKSAILNQCVGIALDHANQRILWTQKGPAKGGQGRIFSAGLEMPVGETAANRSDIKVLLKDLPEPIDLEIDAENALLYWTDRGAAPYGNSLNRARLTPDGLLDSQVICVGFAEAIGLAVDAGANAAFVADLGGQIWRVDLETGNKELIFKLGHITGIALY
ncbi:hypothetical protein [Paraburkholderia hiiakae]|nr:hypothetical protein [Paraburkholderia hiiakae]